MTELSEMMTIQFVIDIHGTRVYTWTRRYQKVGRLDILHQPPLTFPRVLLRGEVWSLALFCCHQGLLAASLPQSLSAMSVT